MFDTDVLSLARMQFAFTVSFHIMFPAMSIGFGAFVATLEGLWLKTGRQVYLDLCLFWSKIFAVAFGMGVVSGIVMSFEFGTNWSKFTSFAGSVTGPLLTYEVMTAFFLEAGFLGIMLFGWKRVGRIAHFCATALVSIGTLISMTWILASNSWMQTPQGFSIVDNRVVPVDWWKIVFNPSFPYRLAHMGLASFIVTALLVAATGAWHLLKGRRDAAVRTMFSMALGLLLVFAPLQIVVGDAHGLNTRQYQPAKIAAIEGLWDTEKGGTALNLFGIPDMKAETTRDRISVPHLGSLILTHSWNGEIAGLKSFPPADRPDAAIVFFTFRIMAGLGMLMAFMAVIGLILRWRGRLFDSPWFHRFVLVMGPSGIISLLAGWITTEAGRQPWVVYGVMRTANAVSPAVTAQQVGVTLFLFVVVYTVVFGTGIYYMLKLARSGPNVSHGTDTSGANPTLARNTATIPVPVKASVEAVSHRS